VNQASNDAAVSIVIPKIPESEFSSVRLQGRGISDGPSCARRVHRYVPFAFRPSCTPLPAALYSRSESRNAAALMHYRSESL
jgi:hypothetical protein